MEDGLSGTRPGALPEKRESINSSQDQLNKTLQTCLINFHYLLVGLMNKFPEMFTAGRPKSKSVQGGREWCSGRWKAGKSIPFQGKEVTD